MAATTMRTAFAPSPRAVARPGSVMHHEDDGAQAIGCIVPRLAPAPRVRPSGTVTRFQRNARACPIPVSPHADLVALLRKEAR